MKQQTKQKDEQKQEQKREQKQKQAGLQCPACGVEFETRENLEEHDRQMHSQG